MPRLRGRRSKAPSLATLYSSRFGRPGPAPTALQLPSLRSARLGPSCWPLLLLVGFVPVGLSLTTCTRNGCPIKIPCPEWLRDSKETGQTEGGAEGPEGSGGV